MSKSVKIMGLVTIIVVLLSFVAVLYIYMPACDDCGRKFCFGNCNAADGTGVSRETTYEENGLKLNQTTTRLCETEAQPKSYLDKICFVGDSRSVAFKAYGIDESKIFAENGLNHEQALTKQVVWLNNNKLVSIPEAVKITAPEIIIVNFGINGINFMNEADFMKSYEKLVDEIIKASPNSIIVLESILPVGMNYENSSNTDNEKIDKYNEGIYQLAKNKKLFYLASNEVMKNSYNDLDNKYSNGDGIHYNQAGCEVILDYIKRHAIIKK